MIALYIIIILKCCLALDLISCNDTNYKSEGDYICKIDPNYDKTKVPGPSPLILDSYIRINDIAEVNEKRNSITLFAWMFIQWNDPGLSYVKKSK